MSKDQVGPRAPETPEDDSWPVGFMIILTLAVLYLGWRLVQGIVWVLDRI